MISVFRKYEMLYKSHYSDEVLNHGDREIEAEEVKDEEKHKHELAFIMENGFKFYFIYKTYKEVNPDIDSDIVLSEKVEENIFANLATLAVDAARKSV